jgi:hypothetical protein
MRSHGRGDTRWVSARARRDADGDESVEINTDGGMKKRKRRRCNGEVTEKRRERDKKQNSIECFVWVCSHIGKERTILNIPKWESVTFNVNLGRQLHQATKHIRAAP